MEDNPKRFGLYLFFDPLFTKSPNLVIFGSPRLSGSIMNANKVIKMTVWQEMG